MQSVYKLPHVVVSLLVRLGETGCTLLATYYANSTLGPWNEFYICYAYAAFVNSYLFIINVLL